MLVDVMTVILGLHCLVQCNSYDDQTYLLDPVLPRARGL